MVPEPVSLVAAPGHVGRTARLPSPSGPGPATATPVPGEAGVLPLAAVMPRDAGAAVAPPGFTGMTGAARGGRGRPGTIYRG